ncbi:hypothetical protein EDB92DRAFT_1287444 [Lactarius akahatsu]|uniref:Fungal STAND N-terminal Goodbye domain-containing protein n=1 Tax=Lactarius akahatsu TaxID=416441 RepID=A0AAD4LAV0_9AGAM|nr:hypothetical protein EDB92DRAFT_1287444 [Lactarius akahatsu]
MNIDTALGPPSESASRKQNKKQKLPRLLYMVLKTIIIILGLSTWWGCAGVTVTATILTPPYHHSSAPLAAVAMSQTPSSASSSSDFQAIFHASMKEYEKKTKKELLTHPLMAQLQICNSPTDILAVLRTQVQQFEQSTSTDNKLTKWLNPTVNVLYAFSTALGEGVGLVFSPAKVIFAGAGVLLLVAISLDHSCSSCPNTGPTQAAKDVVASQDALVDIFERIENFFRRLETYTEVPTTDAMRDIIVKIMVEVLGIFGIVTKEMKQGRAKKYLKKLVGRRDIEDALGRLDRLTQQEAQMAIVEVLKVAHNAVEGTFSTLVTHKRHRKPTYV